MTTPIRTGHAGTVGVPCARRLTREMLVVEPAEHGDLAFGRWLPSTGPCR